MRLKLESLFFFFWPSIPFDDIAKQYSANMLSIVFQCHLSSLVYLSYRRDEMQANKRSEKGREIGKTHMIE